MIYNESKFYMKEALLMIFDEKKLSGQSIYHSSIIQITRDEVLLPSGSTSYRVCINHPGAACVLATTDSNKVILVRQYRYCVGETLLELPAGKIDPQETPESCAKRELAEETPYTAKSIELLYTFYTAPGFCNEKMYLFLASKIVANSQLRPDKDELLQTVELNSEEVKEAIAAGNIKDAKTLIALNYWLSAIAK